MSKLIASSVIAGAHQFVAEAEEALQKAIDTVGPEADINLPNTGYYLPVIYGLTGMKVEKVKDMEQVLVHARELLARRPGRAGSGPRTWARRSTPASPPCSPARSSSRCAMCWSPVFIRKLMRPRTITSGWAPLTTSSCVSAASSSSTAPLLASPPSPARLPM